jgi:pimeloyl-ACP methyl ester carboxylesterase
MAHSDLFRRFLTAAAAIVSVHFVVAGALGQAGAATVSPPPGLRPVSSNIEDVEYPFETKYLPLTMYGESVRLAYMDESPATANGRTVVLLHGLNFFAEYWGSTMEYLLGQGFRVIAIDQIGFGRSSKPIIPYTLGDMALNIRALLQHLQVTEAAIVGHSFGGMVATRFALHFPELTSHLVLVNQIGLTDARLQRPPTRFDDAYQGNLGRSYQAIRNNFERYYVTWDPAAEKYIRIHYGWTLSSEWPRLARVRTLLTQTIYNDPIVYDWPHIQPKTLVIGGAMDGPNFPEQAGRVAETIPNAEIFLIPGVGHNPHLEAPAAFRPKLLEFLRSPPLPRAGR